MRMTTKLLSILVLSAAALVMAGCPPRESIAKIERDPGRYAGKEISIAGRVTTSFGAMGTGIFEIDDGTGRMWVFSERYGVPGRDAKIAVVGRLEQGVSMGGRHFALILRETERRH